MSNELSSTTVSLLTTPPNNVPKARRTRRVFTPARYAPAISLCAASVKRWYAPSCVLPIRP